MASRRSFVKQSLVGGTGLLWEGTPAASPSPESPGLSPAFRPAAPRALDLSPARWIWLPSQRTLPNTVLFFRRNLTLKTAPVKATGYLMAESRYRLFANGERVQFGPAPSDPRWSEADPIDLTGRLKAGENALGVEVLFYGHGDGTWPIGKPGFLCKLDLTFADGSAQTVVSDASWQVAVARAWAPGGYKRWYLRAFQEIFDARQHPGGWHQPGFQPDAAEWLPAGVLTGSAAKLALSTSARDYLYDASGSQQTELRARSIPPLREERVPVKQLVVSRWLRWNHSPEDYFEFVTPLREAVEVVGVNAARQGKISRIKQ